MTTDKGLKKVLGKQSSYRLPSNFTYRMMQQVREEAFARERREEHRLWWALAVFCLCTFCGVTYYVVKLYGASIVRWWHSLSFALPSVDAVLFSCLRWWHFFVWGDCIGGWRRKCKVIKTRRQSLPNSCIVSDYRAVALPQVSVCSQSTRGLLNS